MMGLFTFVNLMKSNTILFYKVWNMLEKKQTLPGYFRSYLSDRFTLLKIKLPLPTTESDGVLQGLVLGIFFTVCMLSIENFIQLYLMNLHCLVYDTQLYLYEFRQLQLVDSITKRIFKVYMPRFASLY